MGTEKRETADVILQAALETLRTEGFSRTSARAIARTGGFNQALIFYHYGSVNELLLAALDHTSEDRLARYREAVQAATSLEEVLGAAARIYREDRDGGHMTVVAEMIAGGVTDPELRPEIMARTELWVDFVDEVVARVLAGSPFAGMLPSRDLAFALIAFYCGVNVFSRLEDDHQRIERLFDLASNMAPMLAPFVGGMGTP